jgi:hypothetical protein
MAEVSSAVSASKAVGYETIDVVIDYLVPIATGVAGFIAWGAIGGTATVANLINSASGATGTPVNGVRIASFIFGGLYAVIGLVFWRLGKRDGWFMHLLGRGIGAYFFGSAIGTIVLGGLAGQVAQMGAIDKLFDFVQNISKGG